MRTEHAARAAAAPTGTRSGALAGARSAGPSAIAAVLRKPSRDGIVTGRPKPQGGFGARSE